MQSYPIVDYFAVIHNEKHDILSTPQKLSIMVEEETQI